MTRGNVTGGWAFRHHRKWFKQVRDVKTSRQMTDAPGD